jgi:hypothetical protein
MLFQQPFNAAAVEPSQTPVPVPEGDYKVVITESGPEQVKDKPNSGMLVLKLRIMEGQYQGRELKYHLNLWNESDQASAIARSQLSAICHVIGVFNLTQSEQLHGIPFIAIVTVNGTYNNVRGVKDLNGNQPGKAGTTAVAAAPAPTAQPAAWPAPAAAPAAQPSAPPAAAAPWGPPAPPAAAPAPAPAWGSQPPAAPAPVAPAPAAAPWSPGPTGMPPAATPPWGK